MRFIVISILVINSFAFSSEQYLLMDLRDFIESKIEKTENRSDLSQEYKEGKIYAYRELYLWLYDLYPIPD